MDRTEPRIVAVREGVDHGLSKRPLIQRGHGHAKQPHLYLLLDHTDPVELFDLLIEAHERPAVEVVDPDSRPLEHL